MERALTNADLLHQIFAYTDTSTNASCVRVCKHWFDPATKYLWHTVDNMWKCFLILAPIIHDEASGTLKFARTLTKEDWARFYRYTSNVRWLILREGHSDNPSDSIRHVMQEVARNRTQIILFPNTTKVTIHLTSVFSENSALYLHSRLTSMEIFVHDAANADFLVHLLEMITDRTGELKTFELSCHLKAISCPQSQLVNLFRSQNNLIEVHIPYDFASALTLSAISSLVHLDHLQLRRCFCQQCSYISRRTEMKTSKDYEFGILQKVSYEAFSNLTELRISTYLKDVLSFFLSPLAPKNLAVFSFEGFNVGSLESLRLTIEAVANTCRSLAVFYFDINVDKPFDPSYNLSLSDFSPLYRIQTIVCFAIYYSRPLLFSEEELERLLTSWPRLVQLHLNPTPLRQENPCVKITILSILARHCPNLHIASLYLDANCVTALSYPTSFNLFKLSRLNFGSSPISDSRELALYISQLCDSRCSVASAPFHKFFTEEMDEPTLATYKQRITKWAEVTELLPFLWKAMKRDLSKVDMLEKKLDESRLRIEALEEQNAALRNRLFPAKEEPPCGFSSSIFQ